MEPLEIVPLDGSFLRRIDSEEPWTEKVSKYVPILGWIVQSHLWTKRVGPIRRRLCNQLISRPRSIRRFWEGDAMFLTIAQTVCEVAQTEMGWPCASFVPEDPFEVVFWSYEDGLDAVAALIELEDHFGCALPDEVAEYFVERTLGEFVAYLAERSSALINP